MSQILLTFRKHQDVLTVNLTTLTLIHFLEVSSINFIRAACNYCSSIGKYFGHLSYMSDGTRNPCMLREFGCFLLSRNHLPLFNRNKSRQFFAPPTMHHTEHLVKFYL